MADECFNCSYSFTKGKLQLLRVSDEKLITESYLFPEFHYDGLSEQPLAGPLSEFSLTCQSCPPGAVTRLSYKTESAVVTAVLGDHVLSVIRMDNASPEVAQV